MITNRVNIPQIFFGDYTLLSSYSWFQHLGLTDERPSLARCHIALRFYAKLTPLALLHCQLTHAPWKWFFLRQPASLPALEGHLSPLLSWKRQREKVDWPEKNNRELRKLSGRERKSAVWQQIRELLQPELLPTRPAEQSRALRQDAPRLRWRWTPRLSHHQHSNSLIRQL